MERSRIDRRTVVPRRGRQGPPANQRTALDCREVDRTEFNWPLGRSQLPFRRKESYWWIGGSVVVKSGVSI